MIEGDILDEKKIAEMLDGIVSKVVDRKLKQYGILQGYKIAGKIESINGNRANVWLNGSSEITPNIPIDPDITIAINDEVWVERINFKDTDRLITNKRPI